MKSAGKRKKKVQVVNLVPPKQYFSLYSLIEDHLFEIHETNLTNNVKSMMNLRTELFNQIFYYKNLFDRSFKGKTSFGNKVYVYIKRKNLEVGIKIGNNPIIIIHKQPQQRYYKK